MIYFVNVFREMWKAPPPFLLNRKTQSLPQIPFFRDAHLPALAPRVSGDRVSCSFLCNFPCLPLVLPTRHLQLIAHAALCPLTTPSSPFRGLHASMWLAQTPTSVGSPPMPIPGAPPSLLCLSLLFSHMHILDLNTQHVFTRTDPPSSQTPSPAAGPHLSRAKSFMLLVTFPSSKQPTLSCHFFL